MKKQSFAHRLKQIRTNRKYTRRQLAELANISENSVRNYEQGICEPGAFVLLNLAQVLDITPEFLLFGENNMNSYTNAIKAELCQLTNYDQIMRIKALSLNSTILAHLELREDLISDIQSNWNSKGIFQREKDGIVEPSYCTANFVQECIIRFCQNRAALKAEFDIKDGMLLSIHA